MKLLGRKNTGPGDDPEGDTDTVGEAADAASEQNASLSGTTAPKGRPTPRRDAQKRRGPVAPAPMTAAEARRRRKELRGPKLSKEERKADKAGRRAEMSERRERMMSGEENYLLPRDRGPVRRLARDIVDSRRNVLGLFMPMALVLIFVTLSVPSPQVQGLISPAMLLMVLAMIANGFVIGRRVNRQVDDKFPGNTDTGWKLGFYAASRASQIRKMRAPRPAVERGTRID